MASRDPGLSQLDAMWYELATQNPASRPRPGPRALAAVRSYCGSGREQDLAGTTFVHIVRFLREGGDAGPGTRLAVGAADFGGTLEELADCRAAGVSGQDYARRVLARYA